MQDAILNWLDASGRVIDATVKRPPKVVRLRERMAEQATVSFVVYQVYDNIVRRLLQHLGAPLQRRLTELLVDPTLPAATSEEWEVPAVGGVRLRSKFVFTNKDGLPSPAVFMHRLGHVAIHGSAEANVAIPIEPVKVGANGSGTIETDVLMATDPNVVVWSRLPWDEGPNSLAPHLAELLS